MRPSILSTTTELWKTRMILRFRFLPMRSQLSEAVLMLKWSLAR